LFLDYLGRAKASAGELRAQLYVALDVGYLDQDKYEHTYELVDKCSSQLSKFMTYLVSQKAKNV
jgi:four helix bundle protein